VESGDPLTGIRKIKSLPGKNIVIWGSVSLVQLLMRHHMVDEYHLLVCPIITGGGKTLFANAGSSTTLTLVESKRLEAGVVLLHYQVNH
jgi:dihydrofolate reductase